MSGTKQLFSENANPEHLLGTPDDVIEGMDVFVGLSGPGIIQPESLGKMNRDHIVFAMSNPDPEVSPEASPSTCASWLPASPDYPNQITSRLAFPGDLPWRPRRRCAKITGEMKMAWPPVASPAWSATTTSPRTTSSPRCSTAMWPRWSSSSRARECCWVSDARFSVDTRAYTLGR